MDSRLPCPSLSPQICSDSHPLSRRCYQTISSSAAFFSFCLQSFLASKSFHWVSSLHQQSKYWSFSFSNSLSNEYSGLISFRIDWFDLLAVQLAVRRLLQHHNLKASILQPLAFFMVQLSHVYMTTGKIIVLTIQTKANKKTKAKKKKKNKKEIWNLYPRHLSVSLQVETMEAYQT